MASIATNSGDNNKLPFPHCKWFDVEHGKTVTDETKHFLHRNGSVFDLNFILVGEGGEDYYESFFDGYDEWDLKYEKRKGELYLFYLKNKCLPSPGLDRSLYNWMLHQIKIKKNHLETEFFDCFDVKLSDVKKIPAHLTKLEKESYEQKGIEFMLKRRKELEKENEECQTKIEKLEESIIQLKSRKNQIETEVDYLEKELRGVHYDY